MLAEHPMTRIYEPAIEQINAVYLIRRSGTQSEHDGEEDGRH
jgi:hypothetical protein